MDTEVRDMWQMLESPPKQVEAIASLFSWALNCENGKPWTLFIDLIGWSMENYGHNISNVSDLSDGLGYMELDYLADALKAYADRPQLVEEWVTELMGAES